MKIMLKITLWCCVFGLIGGIIIATAKKCCAEERTWIDHGEVTHCSGVLTSNNVCIGSESYIDQPDNHKPIVGDTDVFRRKPDKDDEK
jgi:hypothetical protein